MKRTVSSNSESQSYFESPHSPLRFHSPLSDAGDPPESRYVSPEGSPFKIENPKTTVPDGGKFSQFPPPPPPLTQFPPRQQRNARAPVNSSSDKSPSSMVVLNRWVREEGPQTTTRKAGPAMNGGEPATTTVNRTRRDELVSVAALGFRVSQVILCLISFSIMAADKTKGWSGDSYDRYKEYRFCLAVNVIAFVYSAFEVCDAACYIARDSYMINCGFHDFFVFSMDQVLAYLLMSLLHALLLELMTGFLTGVKMSLLNWQPHPSRFLLWRLEHLRPVLWSLLTNSSHMLPPNAYLSLWYLKENEV